jgi:hypothetical protein
MTTFTFELKDEPVPNNEAHKKAVILAWIISKGGKEVDGKILI